MSDQHSPRRRFHPGRASRRRDLHRRLAAIAVPAFLGQRERTGRNGALSDLRNTVIQVEDRALDGAVYTTIDTTTLKTSDGVTVYFGTVTAAAYCLVVDHSRLPGAVDFHFDSAVAHPVPGTC